MSTKIYNAYEYKGTLTGLMRYLFKLREKYWQQCLTMLDDFSQHEVSYYTDNVRIQFHKQNSYHQETKKVQDMDWLVLDKFLKAVMKRGENDYLNFRASAVIYLYKERMFVQFFGIRFDKKFRLSGSFRDFHFQNQSDPPANVSSKDWDMRERIWEKVLPESGVPSDSGLVFVILEESNIHRLAHRYKTSRARK